MAGLTRQLPVHTVIETLQYTGEGWLCVLAFLDMIKDRIASFSVGVYPSYHAKVDHKEMPRQPPLFFFLNYFKEALAAR